MQEKKPRLKIELSTEGRISLAKTFDVTIQNVSQALLFRRNSITAQKIRQAAMQNGGKMIELHEVDVKESIKVLDMKGNVKKVITV